MSERERLIEILNNTTIQVRTLGDIFYKSVIEKIADHLLESGVIVPPVKVGDEVYVISGCNVYPVIIDSIQCSATGMDIFARNLHSGYLSIILCRDNKTVKWYKTKEAAEKALKGGTEQ